MEKWKKSYKKIKPQPTIMSHGSFLSKGKKYVEFWQISEYISWHFTKYRVIGAAKKRFW
jgi:hypothetical protein